MDIPPREHRALAQLPPGGMSIMHQGKGASPEPFASESRHGPTWGPEKPRSSSSSALVSWDKSTEAS